tara:strand:+ start:85 stop:330 length:246 start_codon:yes stop_codon:yes gene_type:complete
MPIRLKNQNNNLHTYPGFEADIDPTQRAWIEVSGKAIESNVRQLRSRLKNNCEFMAVVKADGYGHDAKLFLNMLSKGVPLN